jgi:hypothetical protein
MSHNPVETDSAVRVGSMLSEKVFCTVGLTLAAPYFATFSTASVKGGKVQTEQMFSGLHLKADARRLRVHVPAKSFTSRIDGIRRLWRFIGVRKLQASSIPSATSSGAAAGASAGRHLKEILQLQRAGISTAAAETLLQRMLAKIDTLRTQRDKLKAEQPGPKGKVLGGQR